MTNPLEEHQWWFPGLPSSECPGLQQLEKEEKEGRHGGCRTLSGGPNRNAEEESPVGHHSGQGEIQVRLWKSVMEDAVILMVALKSQHT